MVLFSYGFRLFFLCAALWAIVSITVWVLPFISNVAPGLITTPTLHAYDMLHGFAMAVVAGFLLTAVPKWTNTPHKHGKVLMVLAALWLLGRLSLLAGSGFYPLADSAFMLGLLWAVGLPILQNKSSRNYSVVATLVGYLAAIWWPDPQVGVRLTLLLHSGLILLVAGRIVPLFTQNALQRLHKGLLTRRRDARDISALGLFYAAIAVFLFFPDSPMAGVGLLVAGGYNLARLWGWKGHLTLHDPLLWMMHVSFFNLCAGLILWGFSILAEGQNVVWLHVLTIGGLSGFMLAMMARVSLGHTGRTLEAPTAAVAAFILLQFSMLARIGALWFNPAWLWAGSAALWAAAFGLFVWVYWPVLTKEA